MPLTLAAIQSGTEPTGPLPPGAFHRTLEDPITCPKCSITYNVIADFDEATSRHFPENSRPLLLLLKKAVQMGHGHNHRVTHFETNGTVVRDMSPTPIQIPSKPEPPTDGWSYRKR